MQFIIYFVKMVFDIDTHDDDDEDDVNDDDHWPGSGVDHDDQERHLSHFLSI